MNSWRPYPLLRLVVPFIAGIIIEFSSGIKYCSPWLATVGLTVLLAVNLLVPRFIPGYSYRWICGLLINIFFVMAGYEITSINRSSNDPDYLGRHPDGLFIANITEPPAVNKTSVKAILKIRYRLAAGRWERTCGLALVYLQLQHNEQGLQYGDYLLLRTGFAEITDNSNPHVFNYAVYLKNRGISHRGYAAPYGWTKLNISPAGIFKRMAFQFRDRLLNVLRENHVEGKEFAVSAALLLGYVDELDAGLRKDYAASGAMHILSVSGMHVGIIYIFLEFLLGFLNKNKPGRIFKAIILLVFIWFYALLTGLSPCVLRSAAMLSLPIIGKSLNRSPDIYNIVAASLIFILAMDPMLVTDIGFQLSYLAVIGIVILYKPIYNLYVTSAWLPDKIWSLLAVSIAAQLATLPITLYTFHQFPNYFMLTNVFVVPLSSLIIYVGIFVLVVGTIPVVSMVSAKVLIFLVWLLNSIIHFIEQLPCSTIKGVFISSPEMLVLYLIIAAGFLFLTFRRTMFLWIFLVAAIVFNLFLIKFKVDRLHSSRFLVFNARHASVYEFSCQNKAMIFTKEDPLSDSDSKRMNQEIVRADMDAHGIGYRSDFGPGKPLYGHELQTSLIPLFHCGNFFQSGNCRIGILNKPIPKGFCKQINVEILILSGGPKVAIGEAVNLFHPKQVIIDAANSRFRTLQWMKEASVLKVPCHAVTVNGTFEKEIKKMLVE